MSHAASRAEALPERIDFYRVRHDLACHYNPVDPFERMLVTQIAQAWLCLENAYETQRRYFQANDAVDSISTHLDQYKAVNREITNCERIWRHSILQLERTQRQRPREAHNQCPQKRQPQPEPEPLISEPLVSNTADRPDHPAPGRVLAFHPAARTRPFPGPHVQLAA